MHESLLRGHGVFKRGRKVLQEFAELSRDNFLAHLQYPPAGQEIPRA